MLTYRVDDEEIAATLEAWPKLILEDDELGASEPWLDDAAVELWVDIEELAAALEVWPNDEELAAKLLERLTDEELRRALLEKIEEEPDKVDEEAAAFETVVLWEE